MAGYTPEQMDQMGAKSVSSFSPDAMNQMGSKPLSSFFDEPKTSDPFQTSQSALGHSQGIMDQIMSMAQNALGAVGTAVGGGMSGATAGQDPANFAIGAAKGLGQTASQMSDIGGFHLGQAAMGMGAPQQQQMTQQLGTNLAPEGKAQEVGAGLEHGAEGLIPVGASAEAATVGKSILGDSAIGKWLAERATKKSIEAVQSTAETMTQGEQKAATLSGRLKQGIKGGFTPSDTESRAGEILNGKVGKNSAKNVPVIQEEIAKRGREVEQFLGENGLPVSADEHAQMFQDMKDKASKYMTPGQMESYDHTIKQFEGELSNMTASNTGTYYKALKNFEQNVTARLRQGNEALLTDSGSAQLQAAKDVRTTVRDIISAKHKSFSGKMYDLTSLYDALDNSVTKAVKADTFSKRFPKTAGALKYGLEAVGAGTVYEGAKKSGVPLP